MERTKIGALAAASDENILITEPTSGYRLSQCISASLLIITLLIIVLSDIFGIHQPSEYAARFSRSLSFFLRRFGTGYCRNGLPNFYCVLSS